MLASADRSPATFVDRRLRRSSTVAATPAGFVRAHATLDP
jgi:hypothetical protein